METNSKDILKSIPDFDKFMSLTYEISELMYVKMKIDSDIKARESEIYKIATSDEKYFQNGKPPSSVFIENTYKYPGLNGELIPMRNELARTIATLEEKKLQFDIYKTMIEVWRTLSSNERSSSL